MVLQKINPSLLLANTCFALITSLMYHTIENPDIKMAKELAYSKTLAENSKNKTLEALDNISEELKKSLDNLLSFAYKKIDKNNNKELNKELKHIQKYSIKLADEISGLIELAKVNSGELVLKEDKYDVMEMLDSIKELFLYEKGNKKITVTTDIVETFNSVLYGDPEKIKQIVLYLFSYIIDIIKTGNIEVKIDSMKVGRFCRIKFHFLVDNTKIKDYISENKDSGTLTLNGNYNDINYITMKKLLDLVGGKIEFKDTNSNISELTLSINQRILSAYKVLEQQKENMNINVKYFDASDKRILLVDDNREKLKSLMLLLKPYKVQFDIAKNYNQLKEFLFSDKTYDLILIDDIIPYIDGNDIADSIKTIKKIANYDINIVIMVVSEDSNITRKHKEFGFADYIVKPINKRAINDLLKKFFK